MEIWLNCPVFREKTLKIALFGPILSKNAPFYGFLERIQAKIGPLKTVQSWCKENGAPYAVLMALHYVVVVRY